MKKIITLMTIGIAFIHSMANAQSAWQWAKSAGGSSNDVGNGVAVDANGNIYSTGSFSSTSVTFGSTTLTNHGGLDFYVVKYDPSGSVLWAKGATGVSNDVGYNLTVDASGNVYIVGTTNSSSLAFGTTTLTSHGYDDIFIVKYDNSGNLTWAKNAGGSGNDIGENVGVDASGNVYITGYFASTSLAFGTTTLTNGGGNDFYIAKYDASGNPVWAKNVGGTGNETGLGIATDANGNSCVTGNFSSSSVTFGTTTFTNGGGLDYFTVKYDASGNVTWAKTGTGVSNDVGYNLDLDPAGNVYVIGTTNSSSLTFGTTTLTLHGSDDIFILKYDANGNFIWAKNAGGSGNDIGESISVDNNGNSYIAGYFASSSLTFGTTILTNTGTNNIFLATYDANGNVLGAKGAGGTSDNRSNSIAVDPNGNNAYITGYFSSSSISFATTTLTNAGGNDMYLAKLGIATTGIKEESALNPSFIVAPNPSNGVFELKIKELQEPNSEISISIFNMLGQTVFETKQNSSSSILVKLDNAGVYFVSVKIGERSSTKKLIVN